MNIKNLLEYQEKDFEIIKLERKLNESETKKILNDMIIKVKESQNKSLQLEKNANELILEYEKLEKTFQENSSKLDAISKKKLEGLSDADLSALMNVSNSIISNFGILEKKFILIAEKINSTLAQFDQAKKNYKLAKEKHSEHRKKYDDQVNEIQPKIDNINRELKELERNVDSDLLAKYKQKRQDKMFPIFVPEIDSACGGCRMGLSYGAVGKLKEKGFIECENCRRIIYRLD